MEYIALEKIGKVNILSVFNTTKEIIEDYKKNRIIVDYLLKELGKNYQVVDDKIVEK